MRAAQKFAQLEFDRLLDKLASYARSELTRSQIKELEVVFHPARIEENLDQTSEGVRLVNTYGNAALPDLSAVEDLTKFWIEARSGALADSRQARQMLGFLETAARFSQLVGKLAGEYPRLMDMTAAWLPLADIENQTRKVFNEEGEVRDSASSRLAELRTKLRRYERSVVSKLREALGVKPGGDDLQVTLRNNRFVVQMSKTDAESLQGSVLDFSSKGNTVYFEPAAITETNSERQFLFIEEDQEVKRILRDYSALLATNYEQLRGDLAILLRFDFVIARARFAIENKATRPKMNRESRLVLRNAVHPLLAEGFVPESIDFSKENALVVSGVNAGGKTVLLKLMGIYSLMASIGCFVPGECELPYISGLMAYIGDDQSTINHLSTFTAQIAFIKAALDSANDTKPDELPLMVLIDEIGTGTEPGEGASLAYGIVRALAERNVKLAVTTHYDLLKTLGLEHENVLNASMEFDREKLEPTYRIVQGQPGQSFAHSIARRWELDQQALDYAHDVIGKQEEKMAAVIDELHRLRREAEDAREATAKQATEIEAIREQNEELTKELRQSKAKLAEQLKRVKQEYQGKLEELLAATKKKLKSKARKSVRKQDEYVKAASKTAAVARTQEETLVALEEEFLASVAPGIKLGEDETAVPIEEGMQVRLKSSRLSGEVMKLEKNSAVVSVKGKRMTVKLKDLEPLSEMPEGPHDPLKKYRSSVTSSVKSDDNYSTELMDGNDTVDLHGLTVEEAHLKLDDFLNRCLLSNVNSVRIMHGVGTGRLKQFVQDYLRKFEFASKVRTAPVEEGGVGVTIADLG